MNNPFTEHPAEVGETYLQHLCFAFCCGLRMFLSGFACMIHAVFPFLFVCTASNTLKALTEKCKKRSDDKPTATD